MVQKTILPLLWEVPQEFRDRLGERVGRQRAMFCEGHLLLVLHRPPREGEADRKGRFFWLSPDGTWASSDPQGGVNALRRHLDEYAELVQELDQREECAVGAEDLFGVLGVLAPVHRAARHMHETLQQARKMCPKDRDLLCLRDRAYAIERAAELLYQETKNSLDLAVAKKAEEQAASSLQMSVSAHRLNLLVAFFFPIATLSALFGVNLDHGLEHFSAPWPFLGVICTGLVLGFVLKWFVTQSRPAALCRRPAAHRDPMVRDRTKRGGRSGR